MIELVAEYGNPVIGFELEFAEPQRCGQFINDVQSFTAPGVEVTRKNDRPIMTLQERSNLLKLVTERTDTESEVHCVHIDNHQRLIRAGSISRLSPAVLTIRP